MGPNAYSVWPLSQLEWVRIYHMHLFATATRCIYVYASKGWPIEWQRYTPCYLLPVSCHAIYIHIIYVCTYAAKWDQHSTAVGPQWDGRRDAAAAKDGLWWREPPPSREEDVCTGHPPALQPGWHLSPLSLHPPYTNRLMYLECWCPLLPRSLWRVTQIFLQKTLRHF